jgi:hypothetical protein
MTNDRYNPPKNLRDKYPPRRQCYNDIYMRIQNAAMAWLIDFNAELNSVDLARCVIDELKLDPRDFEPVEELTALMILSGSAKDAEFVAKWREHMRAFALREGGHGGRARRHSPRKRNDHDET